MRISRKQLWMGMAELAAKRSTCYRGNVGCVIIHNNVPISIGYNGPPSGDHHCKGTTCETTTEGGCLRSVHAEDNALQRMPAAFTRLTRVDMYVTSSPCEFCAEKIIDSHRISRVFYQSPYRIKTGIEILNESEVEVYRFSPSGYLVNEKTGEVLEAN